MKSSEILNEDAGTSMPAMLTETRIAYLMLFSAPAMFAVNILVARWMAGTAPPVALAFWRWFGALLLMLILRGPQLWEQKRDILQEWKELSLLGVLGMGVCGAFVYIGAETTEATNIGLLYSSSPVLITLLAWKFYGERLGLKQISGGLLSLAGVLWIVLRGDPAVLVNLSFHIGDFWVLAAVIAWAVYVVVLKYRPSRMAMMTRFTAICLFGSLILLPFYLWESIFIKTMPLTADSLTAVVLLVCIPGFGAYQAYAKAQAVLGAARGGLILYLNPIYVAVLAWFFLGEPLQGYHYLGSALVLPGIFLVNSAGKG